MKHIKRALAALVLLIVAAAGTLYWMGTRETPAAVRPPAATRPAWPSAAATWRWRATAWPATSRGGKPYAGGTPVPTRSAWSTVPTHAGFADRHRRLERG